MFSIQASLQNVTQRTEHSLKVCSPSMHLCKTWHREHSTAWKNVLHQCVCAKRDRAHSKDEIMFSMQSPLQNTGSESFQTVKTWQGPPEREGSVPVSLKTWRLGRPLSHSLITGDNSVSESAKLARAHKAARERGFCFSASPKRDSVYHTAGETFVCFGVLTSITSCINTAGVIFVCLSMCFCKTWHYASHTRRDICLFRCLRKTWHHASHSLRSYLYVSGSLQA